MTKTKRANSSEISGAPYDGSNFESDACIFVTQQDSIAQDSFTRNGINKDLHLIVKLVPFTLRVGSKNLNLKKMELSAKLFYDFEVEESNAREVETLKLNPLDYVCHVDETGSSLAMEMRIGVLTSAHEGAFFRVGVMVTDKDKENTFQCFSAPIKVLSKRSQIRKIVEKRLNSDSTSNSAKSLKRKRVASEDEEMSSPVISVPESPLEHSSPFTPYSSSSSNLQEILQKLEEQQRKQSFLLQQVLQNQTPSLISSNSTDLEQAFASFLVAYQRSSSDERKSKMRKILKQLDSPNLDSVTELVELYSTEGLFPELSLPSCEKGCIHKQQLDAFDSFYSEFMREPIDLVNSEEISSLFQAKNFLQASKYLNQLKKIMCTFLLILLETQTLF